MDVQIDHGDRKGVGDGVAERAFYRSSQVGVREHLLGPKNRVSPELDGVTFDIRGDLTDQETATLITLLGKVERNLPVD